MMYRILAKMKLFSLKRFSINFLLLLFVIPAFIQAEETDKLEFNIKVIHEVIAPLDLANDVKGEPFESYYKRYGLDALECRTFMGTFTSGEYELAAFAYIPDNPLAKVYLFHGYAAHSGRMAPLIELFVNLNFEVYLFDLHGHGLSGGERGSVTSFVEYGAAVSNLLTLTKTDDNLPIHVVGFSTGGSALIEYLYRYEDSFDKVILIAPLIKSYQWNLSRTGFFLFGSLIKGIPIKTSDPLGITQFPSSWFRALVTWNRELKKYEPITREILVLQGTSDKVTAWRKNRKVLDKLLPNSTYIEIKKASHVLFNSTPETEEELFSLIKNYFQ
jgi:alpha-beta hydrolase superfamily lysophospholipase